MEPTLRAYPSIDWMEYIMMNERKKIKGWKNERCGRW